MSVRTAVIPAAGHGSRLYPVTQAVPKELFPILDTPALQLIVEEAIDSGIERIIIVINERKRLIQQYFELKPLPDAAGHLRTEQSASFLSTLNQRAELIFVHQPEQLGLGHAVCMAEPLISDPWFAVMLGDNITRGQKPVLGQLVRAHLRFGSAVIGVQSVAPERVPHYGIVETASKTENHYKLSGVVEKPALGTTQSRLAIAGRYVLPRTILDHLKQADGSQGEIQLTDGIQALIQTSAAYGCEYEGIRLDIGSGIDFIRANVLAALERPELNQQCVEMIENLQALIKPQ